MKILSHTSNLARNIQFTVLEFVDFLEEKISSIVYSTLKSSQLKNRSIENFAFFQLPILHERPNLKPLTQTF